MDKIPKKDQMNKNKINILRKNLKNIKLMDTLFLKMMIIF